MIVSIKKVVAFSLFIISIILTGIIIVATTKTNARPNYEYCVVIDAGHGGRDGGCIGVNGSIEKDLNLAYAKTLKELLETKNIKVIMTRTSDKALYSEDDSNKKSADMRARAKIINYNQPDLVVSVHMNSFPLSSASGARVYYKQGSEPSQAIAGNIQKSLHYYMGAKAINATVGDYYILNCTDYSAVLIECGYLTNASEEERLNSKDYRNKLMHSVYCGILLSLGCDIY